MNMSIAINTPDLASMVKVVRGNSNEEYTEDEKEYMRAVEAYRQKTGQRFLNIREYLAVARTIGYDRIGYTV